MFWTAFPARIHVLLPGEVRCGLLCYGWSALSPPIRYAAFSADLFDFLSGKSVLASSDFVLSPGYFAPLLVVSILPLAHITFPAVASGLIG